MAEVILHVYDLTKSGKGNDTVNYMVVQMNKLLKDGANLGGVFHVAVQIYGEVEWAYGYKDKGTGIFSCPPKKNPNYTYRESIPAGRTHCSTSQMNLILKELRDEWPGTEYSLVSRNSKHFCEEFLERLGVPKLPAWANRFANVGDAAKDVGNKIKQAKKDVFNKFFKSPTNDDSESKPPRRSPSSSSTSKSKQKSQIENLPIIGIGIKSISKNFRVDAPVIALDDKPAHDDDEEEAAKDETIKQRVKDSDDEEEVKIERLRIKEAVDESDSQTDQSSKGAKKEPIVEEPISDNEEEYSESEEEESPKMKKKNNQQKMKAMKLISAA